MADQPYDYTQEDHAREVERVLMYIEQAERKAVEIAASLESEGAADRFVSGLRTAATALRAEHNRLLNTTHFPVPVDPASESEDAGEDGDRLSEDRPAADQQRMAL